MLNRIREAHCEFWRTYFSINRKPGMEERPGKREKVSTFVYYIWQIRQASVRV